ECLAWVAEGQAQIERAAGLYGVVAALREATGALLPPPDRDNYARSMDRVRTQLGEAAFQQAWAAGHSMALEQAIAEALHIPVEAPLAQTGTPAEAPQLASAVPDRLRTLTPRERQVLALIAKGASNRAIADTLVIAERTAEIHVSNILGKLGVTSRTQAAAFALAQGLAAPPDT